MKILIAAASIEKAQKISSILDEENISHVIYTDEKEIKQMDLSKYDSLIVYTPLKTDYGMNFVAEVHKKIKGGIVVLAKSDVAEEIQAKLNFTGAFVLARPFSKMLFIQAVKFANLAKTQAKKLKEENENLNKKIEDIKLVDRAKYCLMEYLRMSEKDAHRYIQKQAMDLRVSQREIAENILTTYIKPME
ncbi:MAG: ANTAR domain-containing protein [Clostridiales bacterium]|nr:ANTAR domain-containing protein [Clostridiales bacterium]